MRVLQRKQRIATTIENAWEFFSNPRNLSRITPPDMKFEIIPPLPENIFAGLIIRYRITPLMGIPLVWVTEITHCEPPYRFVDEQRFGPYRFWHHQHRFHKQGNETVMEDVVHFALRFEPFMFFVNSLIDKKVNEIFDFREKTVSQIFAKALSVEETVK